MGHLDPFEWPRCFWDAHGTLDSWCVWIASLVSKFPWIGGRFCKGKHIFFHNLGAEVPLNPPSKHHRGTVCLVLKEALGRYWTTIQSTSETEIANINCGRLQGCLVRSGWWRLFCCRVPGRGSETIYQGLGRTGRGLQGLLRLIVVDCFPERHQLGHFHGV